MRYLLLFFTLVISLAAVSCDTTEVVEVDPEDNYQLIVSFQSDEALPGYAPRWVFKAYVYESNRLTPNTVKLDFTEFLTSGKGQLPTDLIDHRFNVEAERGDDDTYKVLNAFTAF